MIDPVNGAVLVYNGEIYNHLELRGQLPEPAGGWRGHSDSETILAAHRHWGLAAPTRLRGMYAYVLWEPAQQRLLAVRDPLGIKPLYIQRSESGWRFCSEWRPLGGRRRQTGPESLAGYLRYGAFPEAALPGVNITPLPAGHWLTLEADGRTRLERHWRPPEVVEAAAGGAWRDHLRAVLERSVGRHLLSDVPVACLLSGGIDSSAVVRLAALRHPGLQTFSLGFEENGLDETAMAAEVARLAGADHHRLELGAGEIRDWVAEAVDCMDLPSVDAINTYIVAKAIRQAGLKVALSGLGGDELFGGYAIFRQALTYRRMARWARSAGFLLRRGGERGERLAEMPVEGGMARLCDWRRGFACEAELRDLDLPGPPAGAEPWPGTNGDWFAEVSWAELSGYTRHLLLRDSDQMAMAVSLEMRVPLLDTDLVEAVLRLPAAVKTGYPMNKGLLVTALEDLLPREVYTRPKRGFTLPMREWMQGPLAGFVEEGLAALSKHNPVLNPMIRRHRRLFTEGRRYWTRLWRLAVLGHWQQTA